MSTDLARVLASFSALVPSDFFFWTTMAHLVADTTQGPQTAMLSSAPFAVTPGSSFNMQWVAEVASKVTTSAFAGELMVTFTDANGADAGIATVPLMPASMRATVTTDAQGAFQYQIPNSTPLRRVELIFDDGLRWPAHAEFTY